MMLGWRFYLPCLALLLWLTALPASSQTIADEKADLRVLIDISGSMKQNDPKNLRRPALRLLVGLLPKETRAGVWTFGQYVNMQIPLGQVDGNWKTKARAGSEKIGSPGQFTHIEAALKRATEDWHGAPGPFRRSVLLLTDGMVDISKDRSKNKASRKRILQQILPRLQELDVAIHTIALSKNADHVLMRELAESTGGWYEQVENADQLQKVFLRIFEKVGQPDAVPLKDNKFTIDESITEATVLIFHQPDADPTRIVTPEGTSFDADNAPAWINWHRDEGYDMLTVSDPQAGEWSIRAAVDPDNRVMVVTDLKMQASELPNQLVQGQTLPITVSFTDHGKQIQKKSFLQVVNLTATQHSGETEAEPRPMLDNGRTPDQQPGDGLFSLDIGGEQLASGMGELVIDASGRTFVRQKRIAYEVVPPLTLETTSEAQPGLIALTLRPDARLVAIESLQLAAWFEERDGGEQYPLTFTPEQNGAVVTSLDLTTFSGPRSITVKASGKTKDGMPLEYLDSPMEVEGIMPPPQIAEPTPETTPQPAETLPEPPAPITEAPAESAEPPAGEQDILMDYIWLGLANLLLLLAVGGSLWWLKRQKQKSLVTLVEEETPAKPADSTKEAA
jgi:uncharacterized protein (TIGR03503 family)